jgi:hypothetical protein
MSFRQASLLATVCLTALILAFLYGEIPFEREPYAHWDLVHYKAMAEAAPKLATEVPQPFCFRILGPYFVGLLPLSVSSGFYLLSIVASLVLVIVFYFFLCYQQVDPYVASLATVLFAFNRYLFGLSIWDYFQLNDILALIFLVLLFFATYRFQWKMCSIILSVGMLARETVLMMIPTAFAFLYERQRQDQLKWLALATVPGILMFVGVRTLVPFEGGNDLFTAFSLHACKGLPGEHPLV